MLSENQNWRDNMGEWARPAITYRHRPPGDSLHAKARKLLLIVGCALISGTIARAQASDPIGELLQDAAPEPPVTSAAVVHSGPKALSQADVAVLKRSIDAARRGDVSAARAAMKDLGDPLARKVALWTLVDAAGESLSFFEVDSARVELDNWPRESRRRIAAERLLEFSGKSPSQILAWFDHNEPMTPHGAMALAAAQRMLGRPQEAQTLIRRWWREKSFDADTQRTMLARFGDALTQEDHVRRVDILLYGQTSAARDLFPLLPADQQAAAETRLALRANASDAMERVAALPDSLARSPGVAFERAAYLRRRNLEDAALALVANFPRDVVTPEQAKQIWEERRRLVVSALHDGDDKAAYVAADSGIMNGLEAAEAEFYAGWIALTRLHDPGRAAKHFATIDRVGATPITRARALYWEGRAAEARQDQKTAEGFYQAAAIHNTTFYGQLAGEKLRIRLTLGSDPEITPADRARFEARPAVQAARLLYDLGYRDLYRSFVLSLDDLLPTIQDEALLIDLARGYGDQDLSMRVARAAAQRGFILPQRAYPLVATPDVPGGAEPALVLGIARQESNFDPQQLSHAGARGMMQLLPSTAAIVARRTGVSWSPSRLYEADYNFRLGSIYLRQLVDRFSGSYVMATAGYNAGPGRPARWVNNCGDPRGGQTDPVDFIECIPFSETRNYVMRVLETTQVYRAKLNGGSAPITLADDLRRGAWSHGRASGATAATAASR